MKAYSFDVNSARTTRVYRKKEVWARVPFNEPRFKKNPYISINLEQTPSKNRVTTVEIPFSLINPLMEKYEKKFT